MPVKPSWQVIRLWHVNAALYALIAVVVGVYFSELRWAAFNLPQYMAGTIKSPKETKLYRKARNKMQRGGDVYMAKAERKLKRSLAIDPNTEAVLLMAEFCYLTSDFENALALYRRYLEIDPSSLSAYLRVAELEREYGRHVEAQEVLHVGLSYFRKHLDRFVPQSNLEVDSYYNRKAERIYQRYQSAIFALELRLKTPEKTSVETAPLQISAVWDFRTRF